MAVQNLRLRMANLPDGESMDKFALIHNVNNSNTLISLLNSGKFIVGDLLRSLPSVKAQIWRRCTFDRFIGSFLFNHLERINFSDQVAKIQLLEPDSMRNGICYAGLCPLAIPCFQRNNGSCCPHLIPSQKFESWSLQLNLLVLLKRIGTAVCLIDFTNAIILIVRVSASGLINIQDTFITGFHELNTVYKGVFNSLNWQET
jgi:hypothetical protein